MSTPWEVLRPAQRHILGAVPSTGACTDASLAAHLIDMGASCERSTIARWRAGDRQAPLGLLRPLLVHLGDPRAVAVVLRAAGADLGVRIDVEPQKGAPSSVGAAVSALRLAMGEALVAVERATSPSSPGGATVTAEEAADVEAQLDELEEQLHAARAALRRQACR